jgi:LysM repeat protein
VVDGIKPAFSRSITSLANRGNCLKGFSEVLRREQASVGYPSSSTVSFFLYPIRIMKTALIRNTLLMAFAASLLSSQVACKSGGTEGGSSTYAGGSADYPFDENGNYRPEFLAANGGGNVVDLTKDNPRSEFLATASSNGWSASDDKPKVTTTRSTTRSTAGRTTPRVTAKPKPRAVAAAKPQPKAKPKTPAASYGSHSIAKGDTLFSLAKRYNTSVGAIQAANGLGGSTKLKLGASLRIPKK